MKVECNMINRNYDIMIGIVKHMFLKPNGLPVNHSGSKKMMKDLGLGYNKIHACTNNCVLFYGGFKKLDTCLKCNVLVSSVMSRDIKRTRFRTRCYIIFDLSQD